MNEIKKNNFSNIIKFITGEAQPKVYTISLFLNLTLLFLAIFISIALYRGEFILLDQQISHLDNPYNNPIGLWFFKLGFIIAGMWFAPNAFFIMRNMKDFNKILGNTTGFFYIMAGIGLIIVAFFPTRVSYPMHILGAIWGFGFLIFAILFSTIIVILKLIKSFSAKIMIYTLIFYGPLFLIVVFGLINAGIPLVKSLLDGVPFGDFEPDGWEFYEWGLFFTGLYSAMGTHFIFLRDRAL